MNLIRRQLLLRGHHHGLSSTLQFSTLLLMSARISALRNVFRTLRHEKRRYGQLAFAETTTPRREIQSLYSLSVFSLLVRLLLLKFDVFWFRKGKEIDRDEDIAPISNTQDSKFISELDKRINALKNTAEYHVRASSRSKTHYPKLISNSFPSF